MVWIKAQMDELLSPIKLECIKSSVKWGSTTSWLLVLFTMNGLLFSVFLAFLSFLVRRLQLAAEFFVVVMGILNSKQSCWISPCPFYMYILLNLVILSLAIKSGILRPSSPLIKVCSDHEDSVGKLELKVQKPATTNEIQRTIRIRCSKINDFRSLPSLFSQQPTSKANENNNRSSLERCAAAPRLFFVEVSGGPEEADGMNMDMESEQSRDDGLCADELNVKAETFIRNFYRQLEMQREDYGKRIYEVVQKERKVT